MVYARLIFAMLMAHRGLLQIHLGAGPLGLRGQGTSVLALAQTGADISREADLRKQKRKQSDGADPSARNACCSENPGHMPIELTAV